MLFHACRATGVRSSGFKFQAMLHSAEDSATDVDRNCPSEQCRQVAKLTCLR
jgi:hypothetical protein